MDLLTWRLENKLNQQEVADRIGLKQASISRIESGDSFPSPEVMKLLIDLSDGQITADDLHAAWVASDKRAANA